MSEAWVQGLLDLCGDTPNSSSETQLWCLRFASRKRLRGRDSIVSLENFSAQRGNIGETWRHDCGNGLLDLNQSGVLLMDFCASRWMAITSPMLEHKMVYKCAWNQNTLGQRLMMIDFAVTLSDLWCMWLVVIWISWRGRLPKRRDLPKRVVRTVWECLAKACVREVFSSHH